MSGMMEYFGPMETIKLTKNHTHEGIQYGYSKKHGWMLYYQPKESISLWGWLPCVPKHIK